MVALESVLTSPSSALSASKSAAGNIPHQDKRASRSAAPPALSGPQVQVGTAPASAASLLPHALKRLSAQSQQQSRSYTATAAIASQQSGRWNTTSLGEADKDLKLELDRTFSLWFGEFAQKLFQLGLCQSSTISSLRGLWGAAQSTWLRAGAPPARHTNHGHAQHAHGAVHHSEGSSSSSRGMSGRRIASGDARARSSLSGASEPPGAAAHRPSHLNGRLQYATNGSIARVQSANEAVNKSSWRARGAAWGGDTSPAFSGSPGATGANAHTSSAAQLPALPPLGHVASVTSTGRMLSGDVSDALRSRAGSMDSPPIEPSECVNTGRGTHTDLDGSGNFGTPNHRSLHLNASSGDLRTPGSAHSALHSGVAMHPVQMGRRSPGYTPVSMNRAYSDGSAADLRASTMPAASGAGALALPTRLSPETPGSMSSADHLPAGMRAARLSSLGDSLDQARTRASLEFTASDMLAADDNDASRGEDDDDVPPGMMRRADASGNSNASGSFVLRSGSGKARAVKLAPLKPSKSAGKGDSLLSPNTLGGASLLAGDPSSLSFASQRNLSSIAQGTPSSLMGTLAEGRVHSTVPDVCVEDEGHEPHVTTQFTFEGASSDHVRTVSDNSPSAPAAVPTFDTDESSPSARSTENSSANGSASMRVRMHTAFLPVPTHTAEPAGDTGTPSLGAGSSLHSSLQEPGSVSSSRVSSSVPSQGPTVAHPASALPQVDEVDDSEGPLTPHGHASLPHSGSLFQADSPSEATAHARLGTDSPEPQAMRRGGANGHASPAASGEDVTGDAVQLQADLTASEGSDPVSTSAAQSSVSRPVARPPASSLQSAAASVAQGFTGSTATDRNDTDLSSSQPPSAASGQAGGGVSLSSGGGSQRHSNERHSWAQSNASSQSEGSESAVTIGSVGQLMTATPLSPPSRIVSPGTLRGGSALGNVGNDTEAGVSGIGDESSAVPESILLLADGSISRQNVVGLPAADSLQPWDSEAGTPLPWRGDTAQESLPEGFAEPMPAHEQAFVPNARMRSARLESAGSSLGPEASFGTVNLDTAGAWRNPSEAVADSTGSREQTPPMGMFRAPGTARDVTPEYGGRGGSRGALREVGVLDPVLELSGGDNMLSPKAADRYRRHSHHDALAAGMVLSTSPSLGSDDDDDGPPEALHLRTGMMQHNDNSGCDFVSSHTDMGNTPKSADRAKGGGVGFGRPPRVSTTVRPAAAHGSPGVPRPLAQSKGVGNSASFRTGGGGSTSLAGGHSTSYTPMGRSSRRPSLETSPPQKLQSPPTPYRADHGASTPNHAEGSPGTPAASSGGAGYAPRGLPRASLSSSRNTVLTRHSSQNSMRTDMTPMLGIPAVRMEERRVAPAEPRAIAYAADDDGQSFVGSMTGDEEGGKEIKVASEDANLKTPQSEAERRAFRAMVDRDTALGAAAGGTPEGEGGGDDDEGGGAFGSSLRMSTSTDGGQGGYSTPDSPSPPTTRRGLDLSALAASFSSFGAGSTSMSGRAKLGGVEL